MDIVHAAFFEALAEFLQGGCLARSVERPRSPVWNNYLRMAKVIADAIAKDTAKN